MHENSYKQMEKICKDFLNINQSLDILDVGSCDVTGGIRSPNHKVPQSYRPIFENSKWNYTGLDIQDGYNVDIVVDDLYEWKIPDNSYDVVISGQTLEHVKDTHKFIKSISKALKENGITIIIAPWTWQEHRFPVDCWRILPDGMDFLLSEIAGLEVLKVWKSGQDCIGIAKKT